MPKFLTAWYRCTAATDRETDRISDIQTLYYGVTYQHLWATRAVFRSEISWTRF